jgi:hypothetical protein
MDYDLSLEIIIVYPEIILIIVRDRSNIGYNGTRARKDESIMPEQLEERLTLLEAEVDRLKRKIEPNSADLSWWEKIAGTFAENSAYDEAMKLGREYRESDRTTSVDTVTE